MTVASEVEEHHVSLRTYLIVFALLIALLVITVAAAFLPHFGYLNIGIALAIAVAKATLVVLFFMHVKYSGRLVHVFIIATFAWLGVLFTLTFADYLSRSWLPSSRGWTESGLVTPEGSWKNIEAAERAAQHDPPTTAPAAPRSGE